MTRLVAVIALAVILLGVSTASAQWGYVAPVRVYYPVAPVYAYAYPQTVAMPVVADPVVAPAPVVVPAPVVYPYPVIRGRVYYYGQPVRNVVRAVVP